MSGDSWRWYPYEEQHSSIQVIERGDPSEDRPGVPFGFSRALVDTPTEPQDDWQEHAEMVAGL